MDGAAGDVGDERDEHVIAVGQLGPRGHMPVPEEHLRALLHRVVPSVRDAGRRSDRCLHHGLMEEALRFFQLPPDHVSEHLVLEPLEQRSLIEIRVERGVVGFPSGPPYARSCDAGRAGVPGD